MLGHCPLREAMLYLCFWICKKWLTYEHVSVGSGFRIQKGSYLSFSRKMFETQMLALHPASDALSSSFCLICICPVLSCSFPFLKSLPQFTSSTPILTHSTFILQTLCHSITAPSLPFHFCILTRP